jgi:hypothetical protein
MHAIAPLRVVLVGSLSMLALAAGCAAQPASSNDDGETSPTGVATSGEALSTISCAASSANGYRNGSEETITVVTVDGKPVEEHTADAYYVMAQAAARDGVNLHIVSGFRTMQEQQYLYHCYTSCSCNGCNLAARPGYSNHQSGHALDLNTSAAGVYSWLEAHAHSFGFARTVPSEMWHWEWWGGGPGGGPCAGGGSAPPPTPTGGNCYSGTLGREVANNTCVQSKFDSKWYQCNAGTWVDRWSDPAACSSVHPL